MMMDRSRNDAELHHLFDRIADAYIALDKDWRYTYLNSKAAQMHGRHREDLIGKQIWSEFPEAVDQPLHRAYAQAMAEQRPVSLEAFDTRSRRWFEHRIHPSADGLTICLLDITERKQFDEAQHHSQRMLAEAQDVAHIGSWEWDIAANKVEWSAELYRIYGLVPRQYAATFEAYLSLVHPLDRARVQGIIENACRDHRAFEFEERIVRADGSIRTLHSRGVVQVDREGVAVHMLGVCQDITGRKRAEQLDAGQHDILAGIAVQRPLADNLARIARLHEELNPGALCSVLLLDDAGEHVLHGAGPSLPETFNQAVHGLQIGDAKGSCGTAAWRQERVVVADISTHPYWEDYRALASAHGLKACWSTPVTGSAGQVLGTFAVYYRERREPSPDELGDIDRMLPITGIAIESARLVQHLRERDRFFDLSMEIYCIFDPKSERIVQANPTFSRVTGYKAEELTSRHFLEFCHEDDRAIVTRAAAALATPGARISEFACRFLCKDGSHRWLEWESVTALEGLSYSVARDITERRNAEEKLAFSASHDSVTGLTHYLLLESALAAMLEEGTEPVWVLFIDLDRFQVVNDSMGHVMGDDVLQRMARRLQESLGGQAQIARFAGDEFIVVIGNASRSAVLTLADRLRAVVAEPIEGHDYRLLLTASIGISHSPDHGRSPKDLVRRAEAAMRLVKREGRDGVREFSIEQMQDLEDHLTLGGHLREALRGGEFELHYQPQYSAGVHALTGFETLLRWNSKTLGSVSPGRFIPFAETLGLMPEIGEWILNAACRQARAWLDRGHRDFSVAVNVSAQQFQRPGLVEQVREAISRHSIPPQVLDIELTESSLMENVTRVQRTLAELKALGTMLSLDDFGTGYSSLAYLKHFPIDKLKIDQSFVRGLPQDADDAAIAQTIVTMAHKLRMLVAAEGVETEAQAVFLTGIGCDELQGYHLGRPVIASEAEKCFAGN
jgi:diguanylate cyclase (GGDEF)-like protein/PAS domain S-box-containing protein